MTEPPLPEPLSETELEVLRSLATGATNREIAHARGISEATVKKHVTNINAKLGTGNRTEAVRRALELGLVTVRAPNASEPPAHHDAARHLADELARARLETRRTIRAVIAGSMAVALLASAVAYMVATERAAGPAQATPVPRATAGGGAMWVSGLDLPTARSGLALAFDGANAYAIGGEDATGILSDVLRYDAAAPRWRARTAKPVAVRDASAVVLQGRLIVPGGCMADGRATDVVEVYDPVADRWSRAAPLPEPTCAYGLVALQGQAYLFGGRSAADAAGATARAFRYDPESDAWEALPPMPLARSDLGAVVVSPTDVHVLGGRDTDGQAQTSHWSFRPFGASNAWNTEGGPPLPEGRAGLSAAAILGRVYVIGGGWDRRLEQGSLVWDSAEGASVWAPFADVRGATPQKGAGITAVRDQWLQVAGGETDGRLLAQHQSVQVVWRILIPPGP